MNTLNGQKHRMLLGPYGCLLCFAFAFPFLSGLYPIVRFSEEQIDIHVHPNHIRVEGQYVYKNPFPFPVVQGFSIPLPIDQHHPRPVMVSAKLIRPSEKPVSVSYILGKYRFETAFRAGEELRIKVRYRQQTPIHDACYILTTTRPWRRALIQGTYRLIQRGVQVRSSNYALQPHNSGTLIFHKMNFMPDKDWHFTWEVV